MEEVELPLLEMYSSQEVQQILLRDMLKKKGVSDVDGWLRLNKEMISYSAKMKAGGIAIAIFSQPPGSPKSEQKAVDDGS